jgi:hypothetical protein
MRKSNSIKQAIFKATLLTGILRVKMIFLLHLLFFINIKDFLVVNDKLRVLSFQLLLNTIVLTEILNGYVEQYVKNIEANNNLKMF